MHSLRLLVMYIHVKHLDCCTEESVRAVGAKSRIFPPSLFISNLRSCIDNPQTG